MDQSQQERIEAYLRGELSAEDRQAFENEMATDPLLTDVVAAHQKYIHAIEEVAFRDMLQDIHEKGTFEGAKVRPFYLNRRLWGVAAAVLVLIGSIWFFRPQQEATLDQYLASIELDPGLPTTLAATDDLAFGEGMNAYKLGNYEEAESYWQPLLEASPDNDTLLFFLAQTSLAQHNDKLAAKRLEYILRMEGSSFQDKSTWYLALARLRLGEAEEAKGLLLELSNGNKVWKSEALALLERLDND